MAYLLVILIWSTTPLAIQWSSHTVGPTMSVLMRMLIAASIGIVAIKLLKINFPFHSLACKLYAYSGLGIFAGMTFAYLAATYITSGILSLIFGLSPMLSWLIAQQQKQEAGFNLTKFSSLLVALAGLAVVVSDGLLLGREALPGIGLALLGVIFFSLSSVLVKSVQITINPIATTVGALLFSLPCFTIVWLVLDGTFNPSTWSAKALWSIIYLGVCGSLIGFIAYYYVLQKLSATSVAIITLITPIMAIGLGGLLNNEVINLRLLGGAALVLLGLILFFRANKQSK